MSHRTMRDVALRAFAMLAVAAAPAAAAALTAKPVAVEPAPPMSASALSLLLISTAQQAQAGIVVNGVAEADQQAYLVDAVETAIAGSGASPEMAVEALLATQSSLAANNTRSEEHTSELQSH